MTLKTAKRELGIVTSREGEAGKRGGGRWIWALPKACANIKWVKPEGLHPKSSVDRTDSAHVAYVSQNGHEGLRVQRARDVKGADDACTLNQPLSANVIGDETRRAKSGPALALGTYLQKPSDQRLEWLTKAVLTALGRDTAGEAGEAHAAAVKAAAEDPANHPLDCDCEVCL